jgi:hypothetical protein
MDPFVTFLVIVVAIAAVLYLIGRFYPRGPL